MYRLVPSTTRTNTATIKVLPSTNTNDNRNIDEDDKNDDDEDGSIDEDWYDTLVFYLDGGQLMERRPVPWDTNADSQVTGSDYMVSVLAENVIELTLTRIEPPGGRELVEIDLNLQHPAGGEKIRFKTSVRVGGAF